MSESLLKIEPAEPGQRRHFTAEQKRALLDESQRPGQSMSGVARRYGVAPSLLFQKSLQVDILEEAVEIAREKRKWISRDSSSDKEDDR